MRFNTLPKIRILVQAVPAVVARIEALRKVAEKDQGVVKVGYSQSYAIYVHEVPASHAPGKTDKFLELPARRLKYDLAALAKNVYQQKKSLRAGLFAAGLRLQRESQKIVPIDTGALKASAWTAFAEDADRVSQEAYRRGEQLAIKTLLSRAKRKLNSKGRAKKLATLERKSARTNARRDKIVARLLKAKNKKAARQRSRKGRKRK